MFYDEKKRVRRTTNARGVGTPEVALGVSIVVDAPLEYKRRRVLIGVRDADGGDRKKNNKGSDLSGTTGTVDDEEEEEFAPDYSEECERLQLEVKSLA